MKWLGALLVFLGGLLGGMGAAGRLRRAARELRELERTMALVAYALECYRLPTPALARQLAQSAPGAGAALFARVAAAMEDEPELSLDTLWAHALDGVAEVARPSLTAFGAVLGRYAAEEQARAAERCRRELDRLAEDAERESARNGRVYITVGAAVGAMAAIVMV